MRQALVFRRLSLRHVLGIGWLARLRVRLFGSDDREKAIALRHCSPHMLRDIGLDERRANHLLRDDVFRR